MKDRENKREEDRNRAEEERESAGESRHPLEDVKASLNSISPQRRRSETKGGNEVGTSHRTRESCFFFKKKQVGWKRLT